MESISEPRAVNPRRAMSGRADGLAVGLAVALTATVVIEPRLAILPLALALALALAAALLMDYRRALYLFIFILGLRFNQIPGYAIYQDFVIADPFFFLALIMFVLRRKGLAAEKIPWNLALIASLHIAWSLTVNFLSASGFTPSMTAIIVPARSAYLLLITLVFAQVADDSRFFKNALTAFALGALTLVAVESALNLSSDYRHYGLFPQVGMTLVDKNSLGMVMSVSLFIALPLIQVSRSRWARSAWIAAAAFLLIAAVLSFSKTAWLAISVGLFFYLLQLDLKRVTRVAAVTAAAALLLVSIPFTRGLLQLGAAIVNHEITYGKNTRRVRLGYLQLASELIARHPLTGVGYDNVSQAALRHLNESIGRGDTHNVWTMIGAGLGIPGMLIFATLLAYVFAKLRELKRLTRGDPEMAAWARSMICIFVVFATLGMTTGLPIHNRVFWSCLGLLCGMLVAAKRAYPNCEEHCP